MVNRSNGITKEEEICGMMIENEKKKLSTRDISGKFALHEKDEEEGDDLGDAAYFRHSRHARKIFIREKISEYVDSFTVHGLKRVCTGSDVEKVFWFTMLLAGVILSTYVIHGLVSKFLKRDVYTEIRSQITEQNFFPSVLFCERRTLNDAYYAYCGVPPRIRHKNYDIACKSKSKFMEAQTSSTPGVYWSNGLFNVTKCDTWGGKVCLDGAFFKTMQSFNNSCIQWNFKGDFHDIYSHADFVFEFIKPDYFVGEPVIIAVPQDAEVKVIDITKKVDLELMKHYELRIDKTVIKRLPSPFPSNCTHDKTGDIFPGKYTRRSCIESHNYLDMYKKCGDVIDYIRQFVPKEIVQKYERNQTIREVMSCLQTFSLGETRRTPNCAFPCDELDLDTISSFHERNLFHPNNTVSYHVSIQYQRVDTFKVMEEKELYSWDQLACEIGGLIGLVIGASVISLVEILAYVLLVIYNKFLKV